MKRPPLLKPLDPAWTAFQASSAGWSDAPWREPGVTGQGSMKDLIAPVTWWEAEARPHLPRLRTGGRPPRYSRQDGGLEAFKAQRTAQTRGLSRADVLRHQEDTHQRLLAYVHRAPEALCTRETRFRRRLRLDPSRHYPKPAQARRAWRERSAGSGQCSPAASRHALLEMSLPKPLS